jgi:UDPglucose 6-dehydrogenase
MRVSIFGTGYVGLVTGACLADVGHDVICVDVDVDKVNKLNKGIIPIYEPGLGSVVKSNFEAGNLRFTTDAEKAVGHAQLQFIAVGTPPDEDGSADLQYVLKVADTIATYMSEDKIIIDKSTVPVGTADKVREKISSVLAGRGLKLGFDVVSNPEFLKEGAAVGDFMKPDRIVIGISNESSEAPMKELYAPFNRNHDKVLFMDVRSAELTKYAANAMLATKISFMNEMATLAERLDADIESVRLGIGSDLRIGYHFIYPGAGYGGSCFPKDVQALTKIAADVDYHAELVHAVDNVNNRQKQRLFEKLSAYFKGDLSGKTIAVWGLAFKPDTDDMREAPSRVLMESLWSQGAKVKAYDPEAMEECSRIYGDRDDLDLVSNKDAAIEGADALVICTEWKNFRAMDYEAVKAKLATPVIFDGRNLYEPSIVRSYGLEYFSIGRK